MVFTFLYLANFIHAHVLLQTSTFPLVNRWALCYGHEPHLTHSSAGRSLGYFHCLAIVTSAAINKRMHNPLTQLTSFLLDGDCWICWDLAGIERRLVETQILRNNSPLTQDSSHQQKLSRESGGVQRKFTSDPLVSFVHIFYMNMKRSKKSGFQ